MKKWGNKQAKNQSKYWSIWSKCLFRADFMVISYGNWSFLARMSSFLTQIYSLTDAFFISSHRFHGSHGLNHRYILLRMLFYFVSQISQISRIGSQIYSLTDAVGISHGMLGCRSMLSVNKSVKSVRSVRRE